MKATFRALISAFTVTVAPVLAALVVAAVVITAPAGWAAPAPTGLPQVAGTPVAAAGEVPDPNTAWPILRQGTNSDTPPVTVQSLQYLLNAHGAALAVDGVFGPRTNAAVRSYQQAKGLTVDGIVGPHTWSALIITVQRGSTGPAVQAVQAQFNARAVAAGASPFLTVDGIFGPKTEAAVFSFQNRTADFIEFAVDGIVGPQTWHGLIAGFAPRG